jgi:hypothetical protein
MLTGIADKILSDEVRLTFELCHLPIRGARSLANY